MQLTVTIELDNAAFSEDTELPYQLREVAERTAALHDEDGSYRPDYGKLIDRNGNSVGLWSVAP